MPKRRHQQIHPRQAICTKYHGPGNVRGSTIKATSGSGLSKTVHYDYALNLFENHQAAAYALADKLGWEGDLVGGGTKDGYCFVFVE